MARTFRLSGKLGPLGLCAMLLSLAAHAGVLVLVGSGSERRRNAQDDPPRRTVMSAHLASTSSQRPALPAINASIEIPAKGQRHLEFAPTRENVLDEAAPVVEITLPGGPYYFRSSELTRRPILLGDAISRLIIDVPGFSPAPVILRLLISDDGTVDRVVVEDSYLSKDVQARIVDAFANVRFFPGKIDDVVVRSQMKIEVKLESIADADGRPDSTGSGLQAE